MKKLVALILCVVSLSVAAAEWKIPEPTAAERQFLVANGRAMITIAEDGTVTIQGEPNEEVIALATMLRQATKHACKVNRT